MSETFTKEQVDAAVAEALTPLREQLAELEKAAQDTEVGKAVAAAVEPLNTQIAEMQAKLDDAEVRATAAESAKAELESFWAEAITAHEEAEARKAREEERVEAAKAAGVLSEEYIVANAERFSAWSDDEFAARLEEWTAVAAQAKGDSEIPGVTGFQAARETAAAISTGSNLSLLREMRRTLTDPRSL